MKKPEALKILEQAINYDKNGGNRKGTWCLGTEGVEAVKTAIEALKETTVSDAMQTIKEALKEDKSEDSWYYSWQSNIACTIMDNSDIEHDKANEIAIKFLELLIRN